MEQHGRQRRPESTEDRRAVLINSLYARGLQGDVAAATAYLDATRDRQQMITAAKTILEEMSAGYCERCRPLWGKCIERLLRKLREV